MSNEPVLLAHFITVHRVQGLVDSTEGNNPLALGLLADLRLVCFECPLVLVIVDDREKEGTLEALNQAEQLLIRLVSADKIRAKSWVRRIDTLKCTRSLLVPV